MAGECQPFVQFPVAFYPRGASLACSHLTISQVAETFALTGHSPWWVSGFEQGANEHAVAIGNQAVSSKESIATEPGLIGMDRVRRVSGARARPSRRRALVTTAASSSSILPIAPHPPPPPSLNSPKPGYKPWLKRTCGRR